MSGPLDACKYELIKAFPNGYTEVFSIVNSDGTTHFWTMTFKETVIKLAVLL